MSHLSRVECHVADLDALEQAANNREADLVRDVPTFVAFTKNNKCAHVIRLRNKPKGAYEVGVIKREDGTFDLSCDQDYGSGYDLARQFGRNLDGLVTEYTACVDENLLRKRGYRVRREINESAHIRLVATI